MQNHYTHTTSHQSDRTDEILEPWFSPQRRSSSLCREARRNESAKQSTVSPRTPICNETTVCGRVPTDCPRRAWRRRYQDSILYTAIGRVSDWWK
jgi:hypothetical protein